tara:strand:- start:5542 stop:6291 length:750 start_codon:yes stop_codon:yes gene_type:complete
MEVAIGAAIGAGVGYIATGEAEGALIGAGVGAIGGYAVGQMGAGAGSGSGMSTGLKGVSQAGHTGTFSSPIAGSNIPGSATFVGPMPPPSGFFSKMGTTLAKVSKVATPLMLAGSLLTAGSGVAGAYGAAGQADVEAMYSDRQAVQQELARLDEKDRRVRRYLKDKSDVENYYAGVGLRSDVGSPLVVTSDYFYTLQKDLRAIDMVGYGKIEGYQKEAQTFRTYADRTRKAAPYEAAGQVLSTAGRALI